MEPSPKKLLDQACAEPFVPGPINALRARKPKRLPTVLTQEEVRRVIDKLSGMHQLMATLLYGSGLRLSRSNLARPGSV